MEEIKGKVVYLDRFRQRVQGTQAIDDDKRPLPLQARQALEALLIDAADAPPARKPPARKRTTRAVQTIKGDNNTQIGQMLTSQSITGNGNFQVGTVANLHIHQPPKPRRTPAAPTPIPGDGEITNQQAAEIKRLVGVVVTRSGKSWGSVYGIFNDRFEATSYLMIKRHRYDEAVIYLHKWIASVSTPSARESTEEERKRLLKRIHAQARKLGGSIDSIRAYISGRFGTPSLAELTPGQLQEVIKEFRL